MDRKRVLTQAIDNAVQRNRRDVAARLPELYEKPSFGMFFAHLNDPNGSLDDRKSSIYDFTFIAGYNRHLKPPAIRNGRIPGTRLGDPFDSEQLRDFVRRGRLFHKSPTERVLYHVLEDWPQLAFSLDSGVYPEGSYFVRIRKEPIMTKADCWARPEEIAASGRLGKRPVLYTSKSLKTALCETKAWEYGVVSIIVYRAQSEIKVIQLPEDKTLNALGRKQNRFMKSIVYGTDQAQSAHIYRFLLDVPKEYADAVCLQSVQDRSGVNVTWNGSEKRKLSVEGVFYAKVTLAPDHIRCSSLMFCMKDTMQFRPLPRPVPSHVFGLLRKIDTGENSERWEKLGYV